MSEDNHKPMTEDQATTLKVTSKLKEQAPPLNLTKAEARDCIAADRTTPDIDRSG